MSNTNCDLLLFSRYIVPVQPLGLILEDHAIVIANGKIEAILPKQEAQQRQAKQTVHLDQHVLAPGLINLHAHSAMTLLRGYADDLALMTWLENHIWPAEGKHVNHEFVRDGSLIAMAEMIRGGTTTVNDMYFFHDAVAQATIQSQMNAVIGGSILEFPTPYATNAQGYIEGFIQTYQQYKNTPRLHFALAPHAPYTVSDQTFKQIVQLAEHYQLPIHCHIHETQTEILNSLEQYKKRPLQRLHDLGVTQQRLIGAHMVHLNEDEIELCAKQHISIAHCPASNMKLSSGIAPIHTLIERGINVGLGTDGAASNNSLDMLGDMRLASLLAKVSGNPEAITAQQALYMATLGGAKALGLDQSLGSLEVGKQADIIAVNLSELETQPLFNPISQLVYAAQRHQVSDVWVNGQALLRHQALQTLDVEALKAKAQFWQKQIKSKE